MFSRRGYSLYFLQIIVPIVALMLLVLVIIALVIRKKNQDKQRYVGD